MISQALINGTVAGWNIIFAGNKSEAELEFFSRKLKQHLDEVYNDEEFKVAALLVEKKTRFFPTIADLVEVEDEVYDEIKRRANPKPRLTWDDNKLPEISDEEAALNLKRLEIIVGQLSGKYSHEEALARQAYLKEYPESYLKETQNDASDEE